MHSKELKTPPRFQPSITSKAFTDNVYDHYDWMLKNAPVCKTKMFVMPAIVVASYEGCREMLSSPLFVRSRALATGGGRAFPLPLPKTLKLMLNGLITQDDPNHKRQRRLVSKAFTPKSLGSMQGVIDDTVNHHLDAMEGKEQVDLLDEYCLPIPSAVIAHMLGIEPQEMPEFHDGVSALTTGLTGLSMARTILWDMPKLIKLTRRLIRRKRDTPGDDLMTTMIQAQDDGDRLSEDELVAMTFTLIMAGYETTVHLIGNAVVTLLAHPEQLAMVLEDHSLMPAAIEEVLRFHGPVQGTKQMYAIEDTSLEGYAIPKGAMVLPLLGAANRDPSQFESPNTFDIMREPNKHLGFGHGIHHCLGAALARMETSSALLGLFERFPDLALDCSPSDLEFVNVPMWQRHKTIPIALGRRR